MTDRKIKLFGKGNWEAEMFGKKPLESELDRKKRFDKTKNKDFDK
tara:strand:+ start:837 stop:971 length:135 start_codon:yes stop_codon:yes gene_type:complete